MKKNIVNSFCYMQAYGIIFCYVVNKCNFKFVFLDIQHSLLYVLKYDLANNLLYIKTNKFVNNKVMHFFFFSQPTVRLIVSCDLIIPLPFCSSEGSPSLRLVSIHNIWHPLSAHTHALKDAYSSIKTSHLSYYFILQ